MKKRLLRMIIVILVIIGLCTPFVIFKLIDKKEPEIIQEVEGFNFKDVTKLNYGVYNLSDFIEEDVSCEDKCLYLDKEVTYTISEVQELGEQSLRVDIEYDGKKYSKEYDVEIVDELAPKINLNVEAVTIQENDSFDPKAYLESVVDNYDGDLLDKVEIESNVDSSKSGNYKVTYSITDTSGNTETKELDVVVSNENNNETTDTNDSNTSSTTNTNKNTSTSNKNTSSSSSKNTGSSSSSTTSGFKKDINSVKLNPMTTRYDKLDKKIEQIIKSQTNDSMDNYDKLHNVYHYVIDYLSYGGGVIDASDQEYVSIANAHHYYLSDSEKIYLALSSLDTKKGVCDNYAALFMILARRLGFDAYVVNGQIKHANGQKTGHAWVMLKAGNTYYVFDPEAEDEYGKKDHYFGKTTKERNVYTYNLDYSIADFNKFQDFKSVKTTFKISGAIEYSHTNSGYKSYEERDYNKTYQVKKGDSISIETTIAGNGAYLTWHSISEKDFWGKSEYLKKAVESKSTSSTYTFNTVGEFYIYVEIRDSNSGVSSVYYLYVDVTE